MSKRTLTVELPYYVAAMLYTLSDSEILESEEAQKALGLSAPEIQAISHALYHALVNKGF